MMRTHKDINSFLHPQTVNMPQENMLTTFSGDPDHLLFAVHNSIPSTMPQWAVLDEATVDELVEYLMVWKIRKKARDESV